MSTAAQVISLNSALTACERADEWQLAAAMLRSLRGWGDEIHPGPSPSPLWECHLGWNLIDYILFMIFFQIKISIFWGGVCIFILTNTQMGHSDHWTLIWGGFLQPDATSSAICTAAFGKPSMDWCCSNLGLPWFVQKWCIPKILNDSKWHFELGNDDKSFVSGQTIWFHNRFLILVSQISLRQMGVLRLSSHRCDNLGYGSKLLWLNFINLFTFFTGPISWIHFSLLCCWFLIISVDAKLVYHYFLLQLAILGHIPPFLGLSQVWYCWILWYCWYLFATSIFFLV